MTELLEIVRDYRMQYTLNDLIKKRGIQLKEKREEEIQLMNLLRDELTESQFLILNRYLDAQNYISAEYGEIAYELGLRDGVNLVRELEVLALGE